MSGQHYLLAQIDKKMEENNKLLSEIRDLLKQHLEQLKQEQKEREAKK